MGRGAGDSSELSTGEQRNQLPLLEELIQHLGDAATVAGKLNYEELSEELGAFLADAEEAKRVFFPSS
jgi:hypothetical protein